MNRPPEPSQYHNFSNRFRMDSQVPLENYGESSHLNERLSQTYYTHGDQGMYDSYASFEAPWECPNDPFGENMDLEQDPFSFCDPMIQDDGYDATESSAVISPVPPFGEVTTHNETTERNNNPVANFEDIF